MDNDLDEPSMFDRILIQALLQGVRLVCIETMLPPSEGRDGVGNRVIEAAVERTKFGRGDRLMMFPGQLGDGLAHISVVVDDLVNGVPKAEQLGAMHGGGATDLRGSRCRDRVDGTRCRCVFLETKGFDELLQEEGDAMIEREGNLSWRQSFGYLVLATCDQLCAMGSYKLVEHGRMIPGRFSELWSEVHTIRISRYMPFHPRACITAGMLPGVLFPNRLCHVLYVLAVPGSVPVSRGTHDSFG